MITYPSTYGMYEENAKELNDLIHEAGGHIYMDGANFNALLGKPGKKVADLGFDVCHFNMHKTFSIPHGGGGPGMGPIAVKGFLKEYLPKFNLNKNVKSVSTSPYGSGSILHICDKYLDDFDDKKLLDLHLQVRGNTDYTIEKLSEIGYKVLHKDSKNRAHEFIIDTNPIKKEFGITEVDIAKRLMDYGFHAPTMSWPLSGGLMIEITESEPKEEIDRFIEAMKMILLEIQIIPEILKNAPHTQKDLINWSYSYSIKEACYPVNNINQDNKYWPTRKRIDDVYGDKLFNTINKR
jgi:glycine dehydrogenase